MLENKKIVGATPFSYGGINFKSKIEVQAYKKLVECGFNPKYEEVTFLLWEGGKPTIPYFNGNKSQDLKLANRKISNITYTPDFSLEYNGIMIFIEIKGFRNDLFPYKFKMFRKVLESIYDNTLVFEIHSMKQLLQAIDIIKNYEV